MQKKGIVEKEVLKESHGQQTYVNKSSGLEKEARYSVVMVNVEKCAFQSCGLRKNFFFYG